MNFRPNKHSMVLALFAILVTSTLAAVHELTRRPIAANNTRQLQRQLTEILPPLSFNNSPQSDRITIANDLLGTNKPQTVYRARKDAVASAAIIHSIAPDGYSGEIELLVAILENGTLAGVRVTLHSETPGLGDDIERKKSLWITQFDGKSLRSPQLSEWLVEKDGGYFDQLTGATITPRAVVRAIKNTLLFFENNRHTVFAKDATSDNP